MSKSQQSLIGNIAYKFGLTFFKMVLPVLVMPYVYRQISPEDMGLIGYVMTIMSYFYVLGDFGYYIYGFRETILLKNNKEQLNLFFNETIRIRTIINSLALILYVFFTLFFRDLSIPIVFYAAAGIQILATYFNVESFFEGIEKFKFITIKTICIRVISVVCIFLFVKNSSSNSAFIYLLILSLFILVNNIISFLFLLKKKVFKLRRVKGLSFFQHLKKMGLIFIMINAIMLFFQLDKLVIGINGDLIGLSFYGLSEKITVLTTSLLFSIITAVTPKLGDSLLVDKQGYKTNLSKVLNTILLFLFPTAFFLIASSVEVLFILGGEEYLPSKDIFILFSIYIIIYTLIEMVKTNIFILIRKEKVYFFVILIGGMINLLLKLSFKDILTVWEIMIITIIVSFAILLALLIYIRKELEFKIVNNRFFIYLTLSLPILFVSFIKFDSKILSLFIKGVFAGVYYLTLLVSIKDPIFKEITKKIFNR